MEEVNFRFVRANGAVYLRKEDVIQYVLEFAECEEKDVRDRLKQAAENINEVGRNTGCNMSRPEGESQSTKKVRVHPSQFFSEDEWVDMLKEQQKRALDKWNNSL